MTTPIRVRAGRARLAVLGSVAVTLILAGCGSSNAVEPGWTLGPTLAPAAGPSEPVGSPDSPSPAIPSASSFVPGTPRPDPTPKTFSGRMTPEVVLNDGYVSMYMDLENTGQEPLTFLNTLYDIEPDKLYAPVVVFPWTSGENAVYTRAGRFFPSPAIVQPGDRAVYVMGGMEARGSGELAEPVANIKFCPTRGMDDLPSLPVDVTDVDWSTTDGVTTVTGMLIQTDGVQRVDPPVVGVAFFDESDSFVGAVVNSRAGIRLVPGEETPFTIDGHGVKADRIVRAEAFAFVS
jgi:hypothetical protein